MDFSKAFHNTIKFRAGAVAFISVYLVDGNQTVKAKSSLENFLSGAPQCSVF